jgi:hypothetical protein
MVSLLTSPLAVSRGGRAADNLAKVTETHGSVVTIGPRATSGMSESSFANQPLNLRGNGIENRADIAIEVRVIYVYERGPVGESGKTSGAAV